MRAIKIDALNRTIIEIDINGYKDMQAAVEGCICLAFDYPDDKHSCYINDEGLLCSPQHFFVSKFVRQPFAGNGIIVGNTPTGNTKACTLKLDDVKNSILFLTLDQVQELIRAGAVDYSTYITTSDGVCEKISTIDLGAFNKKD